MKTKVIIKNALISLLCVALALSIPFAGLGTKAPGGGGESGAAYAASPAGTPVDKLDVGDSVYFGRYPQTDLGTNPNISSDWKYGVDYVTKVAINYGTTGAEAPWTPETGAKANDTGITSYLLSTAAVKQVRYFKIEPIKWCIVSTTGGIYTLLSEYNLDVKAFNGVGDVGSYTNYSGSAIRSWLNGYGADKNSNGANYNTTFGGYRLPSNTTSAISPYVKPYISPDGNNSNFIDGAFTEAEQSLISVSAVNNSTADAAALSGWTFTPATSPDTQDKIFLPSTDEYYKWSEFSTSQNVTGAAMQRRVQNTDFVRFNNGYNANSAGEENYSASGSGFSWLRSPGDNANNAARVGHDGSLGHSNAAEIQSGVRPALNLELASPILKSLVKTEEEVEEAKELKFNGNPESPLPPSTPTGIRVFKLNEEATEVAIEWKSLAKDNSIATRFAISWSTNTNNSIFGAIEEEKFLEVHGTTMAISLGDGNPEYLDIVIQGINAYGYSEPAKASFRIQILPTSQHYYSPAAVSGQQDATMMGIVITSGAVTGGVAQEALNTKDKIAFVLDGNGVKNDAPSTIVFTGRQKLYGEEKSLIIGKNTTVTFSGGLDLSEAKGLNIYAASSGAIGKLSATAVAQAAAIGAATEGGISGNININSVNLEANAKSTYAIGDGYKTSLPSIITIRGANVFAKSDYGAFSKNPTVYNSFALVRGAVSANDIADPAKVSYVPVPTATGSATAVVSGAKSALIKSSGFGPVSKTETKTLTLIRSKAGSVSFVISVGYGGTANIPAGTSATSWFGSNGLPAGVTAKASATSDKKKITVTLTGKSTKALTAKLLTLTLPAGTISLSAFPASEALAARRILSLVKFAVARTSAKVLKWHTVKITGTAKVGRTLTAKVVRAASAQSGLKKATYSYQWLRNGKPIKKATKSKYKLTKADKNKKISVRVTASFKPLSSNYALSGTGKKAVTSKKTKNVTAASKSSSGSASSSTGKKIEHVK